MIDQPPSYDARKRRRSVARGQPVTLPTERATASTDTGASLPPHHCQPSDYVAMIVRLQRIEAGELRVGDQDWRTTSGVLWRMLHYATRCTDASVDAFLREFEHTQASDARFTESAKGTARDSATKSSSADASPAQAEQEIATNAASESQGEPGTTGLCLCPTRQRLETQLVAAEQARAALRALLLRIRGWDMLDAAVDGQFWKHEIDALLRPPVEQEPRS